MAKVDTFKLPKLKCKRCGHTWIPRIEDVKICPECKSYLYNYTFKERPA